jgi:hypothetical protein
MAWGAVGLLLLGSALTLVAGWVQRRWSRTDDLARDQRRADADRLERLQDALALVSKLVIDEYTALAQRADEPPDPMRDIVLGPPRRLPITVPISVERDTNLRRALIDVDVLASRTADDAARKAAEKAIDMSGRIFSRRKHDEMWETLHEAQEAIRSAIEACGTALRTLRSQARER